MEKIQKALEKANKKRRQNKESEADSLSRVEHSQRQSQAMYKVEYTHTKVVDISQDVFNRNKIISAVPQHEFKDSYRMLRTRVLQSLRANNWNSLAVTGPASGCGKTLTAINLAISMAMEVDSTVLLVDLDLRKPSVHRYFEYEPEYGINDYLFNDIPVEDILFTPGIDRLVVLPGRESVNNSSEMLRSPKMLSLIDELRNRYPDRYVIVDLPPVLAADDALSFSPYIDALLIVAEDGSTKTDHLEKALEVLKGSQIIGTVLNKATTSFTGYGYYQEKPSSGRLVKS